MVRFCGTNCSTACVEPRSACRVGQILSRTLSLTIYSFWMLTVAGMVTNLYVCWRHGWLSVLVSFCCLTVIKKDLAGNGKLALFGEKAHCSKILTSPKDAADLPRWKLGIF